MFVYVFIYSKALKYYWHEDKNYNRCRCINIFRQDAEQFNGISRKTN